MTKKGATDFDVIYLTGAPASGKSTLAEALASAMPELIAFSYSKALAEHVKERTQRQLSEEDIRAESASVVTPQDVAEVDRSLLKVVQEGRGSRPIVIDSHAVTKERYGFRVTPFSIPVLRAMAPTMIVMLYTDPQVAIDRIQANSKGRPTPTAFESALHTELQGAVALTYGIQLGIPIYLLDSARPTAELVGEIARRMRGRYAQPDLSR